ncbi:hypothetical protein [Nocardia bhagyanarayanae]|uniref:Uncharacterized protein n=1 Tax=Nocardia bhagyanarayanae TaxID=1215925 RepID=A0A543FIF1_9NOCA|nr:hypothetical protein [Nocardia bhagyanarayanae]TQM33643.1 hypothetical protein FB390_5380 [Nocardia bhagyanarayanae]
MRFRPGSNSSVNAQNQVNIAKRGGTVVSSQNGSQTVNIIHNNAVRRVRLWYVLAVLLLVDIVFIWYAQAAYTGVSGDGGDQLRSATGLLLIAATFVLARRCIRELFGRWK